MPARSLTNLALMSEVGSVELVDVTKRFGEVTAVNRFDLAVVPGEFLSLLGPSGCGKTTTLRMLAGFEEPDEGEIRISGQDVSNIPPYRRDVNTVFQHYALFPHMTVADNVAYGLRQKGERQVDGAVGEALEMVQMSQYARRKPQQLSGGQQQRVAVARALVNKPALLLLDEPLGALDRKLREEMQIELKLLQTQVGITFVYVTHDQEEALSMSDRIAVMLDGGIEQLGDPETIYDRPTTPFVASFIGQQNFFEGTVDRGGNLAGPDWVIQPGRVVVPVAPGGSGLGAVRPESITVTSDESANSTNQVAGTLIGLSHLGDVLQYVVMTSAGQEIVSRRPRAGAERLAVGTSVWCRWEVADAQLFDAQTHLGLGDASEAPLGSVG
jgi:spermidine/putrescine transport system ATP-binding protein